MASYLPLFRMLSPRATYAVLRPCHRALGPHFSTWYKLPTICNNITSVSILRVQGSGVAPSTRHIAEWHTRRHSKTFTQRESLVATLSVGIFLLYFMWLREPSDIDEYMSQPIWKRVPGIDPEKAEQMMEVDKYLGLQVDYAELEKYKQEYYEKKFNKLIEEQQQRQKHQELLEAATSHNAMFRKVSQTPNVKD